ncbi:hypothetical protein SUDANB21_05552 [Streptomyces sp. enrichment culture]
MSSQAVTTVALLADPDAPTEIAHRVAQKLPERLSERAGDGREFDVHVVSEPFTAGAEDPATLRRRVLERGREEDWDVVVASPTFPFTRTGASSPWISTMNTAWRCCPFPHSGGWVSSGGPGVRSRTPCST